MTTSAYRPPEVQKGPAAPVRRRRPIGARLLLISFGAAVLLPDVLGFLSGFLGPFLAVGGEPSAAATVAFARQVLAFNSLLYSAALSVVPLGIWLLARHPRTGPHAPPSWWRLGAALIAAVSAGLAWVRGIQGAMRFMEGAPSWTAPELRLALMASEVVTLVGMTLVIRRMAVAFGSPATRHLADATLALVVGSLAASFVPETASLGVLIGGTLLRLAKWALLFVLLWKTQGLERAAMERSSSGDGGSRVPPAARS